MDTRFLNPDKRDFSLLWKSLKQTPSSLLNIRKACLRAFGKVNDHVHLISFSTRVVMKLHGRFLLANKFGLDALQSAVPGDFENIGDKPPGQAAAPDARMYQHADAADMPFPAAQLLMQRRHSDNFFVNQAEQGKVAPVVNVLAPVMDHLDILHAVFDEHALGFGNALEQLMKFLFVIRACRNSATPVTSVVRR